MSVRSIGLASAGLAIAGMMFVASCGSGESEGGSSFAPSGETITVQALDNSFRPAEFEITAGTEVIFENRGRNDHNILPDSVANDDELAASLADGEQGVWGVVSTAFASGDSYSHVFTEPGTYSYYCSIHGSPGAGMYGTLVVTEPGQG